MQIFKASFNTIFVVGYKLIAKVFSKVISLIFGIAIALIDKIFDTIFVYKLMRFLIQIL